MENAEIVWISEKARLAFEELKVAREALASNAEKPPAKTQECGDPRGTALHEIKLISKQMVSLYRTFTERA